MVRLARVCVGAERRLCMRACLCERLWACKSVCVRTERLATIGEVWSLEPWRGERRLCMRAAVVYASVFVNEHVCVCLDIVAV